MPMQMTVRPSSPRTLRYGPRETRSTQPSCTSALSKAPMRIPPFVPAAIPREPTWKSRDYTRAAKHAAPIKQGDRGPESMPFPVHYGIELEMDNTNLRQTRLAVAHALGGPCQGRPQGVTDEVGRLWEVKPDEGTLVEVASPVLGGMAGLRDVQSIASRMAAQGAVAHERTGTHFHVDARGMDVPHVIRLIGLLARHERLLYRALGVHSGRARYCMPMERKNVLKLLERPPTSPVDLCKLYRGPYGERERGLNVENLLNRGSKVTLEFRYFNGTLDPHLIGCYAGLVMGLTQYAMASRHLPSRQEVLNKPSLPALLQQLDMPPAHPVSTLLVGRMLAAY